jgi:hypothetical protein
MNHSPNMRSEGFGSYPHDPLDSSEIPSGSDPEFVGAYGLTQQEGDRLRDILRRE